MAMALLDNQASMYLKLQGSLPEMFLITEIFGRSEAEAEKIIAWREAEALKYHPAVLAIRLVAERARLRKELGLPPVEDEEATLFEHETQIRTVSGKVGVDQEGKVDLGGLNIPPGLKDAFKRRLLETLAEGEGAGGFGVAHFTSKDGPGTVTFPDGRELHFGSPQEFFEAVGRGEVSFNQEGEDGDDDEDK